MYFNRSIMSNERLVGAFTTILLFAALAISCGNGAPKKTENHNVSDSAFIQQHANRAPVQYTYKVIAIYPHDITSYTQGLYWHDGYMWEGTGEYGNSKLRQVRLETGEVMKELSLEDKYFGEGIALLDGLIYQLTWREGECFVYDSETFEKVGSFLYAGEGWGLTTDGEKLYMSDGSSKIKVLDPENFEVVSSFEVRDGRRSVAMLNELEWIDGLIWANVYQTDDIVVINPETGEVAAHIDLSRLLPTIERTPYTDVLNGIAYDAGNDRIFVTGKRWPKIYEIELVEL